MTAIIHSGNALQHQIMVAETVKYPVNYPALIPLSPSVTGIGGIGGGYSCTSSMLQANYSSAHGMDQKPPAQLQPQHHSQLDHQESMDSAQLDGEDTPMGLGAPGLHLPSTLELAAQLRKKELFSQRKQREFIPDSKKDDTYWDRRRRNNEAAKRSREKRRFNDMILEQRVIELSKENHIMKAQLTAIKDKYGIVGDSLINMDQVLANIPQPDQIIAIHKRTKFGSGMVNMPSPNMLNDSHINSPTPNSYHMDSPESPQNYSHYGSHDDHDHDSHFDGNSDQYNQSSSNDLYYRSSALNLSTHSSGSHSPLSPTTSHMEYSPSSEPEILRRSPTNECGSSLPHKLRHKSHLGDKDAAQSLLALQGIKTEPHDLQQDAAEDSVGSSDERDSGIGYTSSSSCDYQRSSDNRSSSPPDRLMTDPSINSRSQQPLQLHSYHQQQQLHHHQQQLLHQEQHSQHHPHHEEEQTPEPDTHLRSELERIASEVATLKYMLVRRPRSEGDSSDSSH